MVVVWPRDDTTWMERSVLKTDGPDYGDVRWIDSTLFFSREYDVVLDGDAECLDSTGIFREWYPGVFQGQPRPVIFRRVPTKTTRPLHTVNASQTFSQ